MSYLPGNHARARWKRLDTAQILKRFFFCERSLIAGASRWIPHVRDLDLKTAIPFFCWQNAETANALRHRVFELRYPSQAMEHEGADRPLVELLNQLQRAPTAGAFLLAWGQAALGALRDAYREFLGRVDTLADAPTCRFLELSLGEKEKQIALLTQWAENETSKNPAEREASRVWANEFAAQLQRLGGIGTDSAPADVAVQPISGSRALLVPDHPGRDERYWPCRFYWPDIVDPTFPYGDGLRLQLRSAISHINEVWAVEHGGIALAAFADVLPWEWIYEAARWTYDESRHCRMGQLRFADWGFSPAEIPLGSYIYESANGQDPIYRLGMLYFFETKNIGRKPERTAAFKQIGDAASEHDMDFDWADETIHASYGNRWLRALHDLDPAKYPSAAEVRNHCETCIEKMVASASPSEKSALAAQANALIARAECLAVSPA
jgi:uncharacterized ferritin-like protein (DUF455 family)